MGIVEEIHRLGWAYYGAPEEQLTTLKRMLPRMERVTVIAEQAGYDFAPSNRARVDEIKQRIAELEGHLAA